MLPTLFVILTFSLVYWCPVRRWMSRWGATPSDVTRVMAGDALVVNPTYSGTMAVNVNAAPDHIWPWLVQIGYQRGGLYSYDWLDRLFLMTRRMLLGLKRRAEALRATNMSGIRANQRPAA